MGVDRTPPRNDEEKSVHEESEEEVPEVVYPSGRLGWVTRKKNEILKHMQKRDNVSIQTVEILFREFQIKFHEFQNACVAQLAREDVPTDLKLDFDHWYLKHKDAAESFGETTKLWLTGEPHISKKTKESVEEESKTNHSLSAGSSNGSHSFSTDPSLVKILQEQAKITMMLAQNQATGMLPLSEPKVFDGRNPLDFKQFILAFERTIEARTTNNSDRYYNLIKYTSGEAQSLVLSCDHEDIDVAYDKARRLLRKQYGNEFVIANHYLVKLEKWKEIQSEDPQSLSELSLFLTKCETLMGNMSALNQLNSLKEIRDIVKKLPVELRVKFRNIVATKTDAEEPVTFHDLVEFVSKQARILQVPLFGDIVNKKRRDEKSFHASAEETQKKRTPCPCCRKNNHWLDNCFFFNKKSFEQKQEIVKKNNLCLSCLKTPSHSSEDCKNRLTCKKCQASHPTSLHREDVQNPTVPPVNSATSTQQSVPVAAPPVTSQDSQPEKPRVATHHATINKTKGLVYPSVLVDIKIPGHNGTVRTYLGMDPFSSSSFMDYELLHELGGNIPTTGTDFDLTTMLDTYSPINMVKVPRIEVRSLNGNVRTILRDVLANEKWPFAVSDSPTPGDSQGYSKIEDLPIVYDDVKIGLLVGINRPDIIKPYEVVHTTRRGPYATKHLFGWCINGPASGQKTFHSSCFHARVGERHESESTLSEKFEEVFAKDFETTNDVPSLSFEDKLWMKRVESSIIKRSDSHFQINLPFRDVDVRMPNNYDQASFRMIKLHKRFVSDPDYFKRYSSFIREMIDNKHAEEIPKDEIETQDGKQFYLVHFSVEHKQKRKLRVVFDCSLHYAGVSLNDTLLQGPDLANSLVGVLLRFRQDKIAFSADVKAMFYQVGVPDSDANFLRFLWYPNNDLSKKPTPHRIKVHVFGARSSPSCANFALKHVAVIDRDISEEVRTAIRKSFYVDDLLKSLAREEQAIELASHMISSLKRSGFELVGFASNSRLLIESLPRMLLSKSFDEIDLANDDLPYERALGMIWNTESDQMSYRINLKEHPRTRRGILSTLFSIYDPLFLVAPAVLPGKRMFQELCSHGASWDDVIDPEIQSKWNTWISELPLLSSYEIPRCLLPKRSEEMTVQIHTFCDGSMTAYGAVSYLRVKLGTEQEARCNIIMAKSRLTPLNKGSLKTVPRIELNSAKLAVILHKQIESELDLHIDGSFFWSDSSTVLSYIKSETGRFLTFVANRIAFIRSNTAVEQWRYVPTDVNPADILSRGSKTAGKFVVDELWKFGPQFLTRDESEWPEKNEIKLVELDEIKKMRVFAHSTVLKENATFQLLNSTSNWYKLVSRVAVFAKLRLCFLDKVELSPITSSDRRSAELDIWRYVQKTEMKEARDFLRLPHPKRNSLRKLNPFLDDTDIVRVGGRLRNSDLPYSQKHPILLPKKSAIVEVYCGSLHKQIGHLGRDYLLAELRKNLYVIGATYLVKKILRQCVICRRQNGKPCHQKMADLPSDRVVSDLPVFSNTGVDYFGPLMVSRGRGRVREKRYGVIFTCLSSRAMHLEIAHSLDVDSFINALKRFTSRRGAVKTMRSDCGTNFVAGERELRSAIEGWNKDPVNAWCLARGIEWKFNPPAAPHFGGSWEREIRSIKKVLNALCFEFEGKIRMTDEILSTFMCEVENILNNRPLTSLSDDPSDPEPLTPNHLLRFKSHDSFSVGIFNERDIYHRRKWRQVQHMADVFWSRFRREYLPLLMQRQKWAVPQRNIQPGDLVLVVDQNLPRNLWCTGRIENVREDDEGMVRSALVTVARCKLEGKLQLGTSTLERPISKLILLKNVDDL